MANQEHVKIIKQGVKPWNRWRNENPDIQPDLSEADLRGEGLGGANLSNTLLEGVKLARASLRKVDLRGANLNNAKLRWAELTQANLTEAELSFADLRETNLNNSRFDNAYLREANLSKATLHDAILNEANLSGANLSHADLRNSKLDYANLMGANFANATLLGAKFSHTNLNEAELSNAQFKGADLSYAELKGANLSGAILYEADIRNATFTGANLAGADFTRAHADEHQFAPKQLSNKQREQLQFSIEMTVKEPASEQTDEKQAKYGEGTYGQGPYGVDENIVDDTMPVREYHQKFMLFLSADKGYPSGSFMGKGSRQDSGEYFSDIVLEDPESEQKLAVIEVNAKKNGALYVREKSALVEKMTRLGVPLYVIVSEVLDSNDDFGIQRLTEKGDLEYIALEDFPTYEDLRGKKEKETEASVGEGGDDEELRNVFRENLIAFLINEKKFPRESLNHGILAEAPDLDLTVTHPDTDKFLAIFEFKFEKYSINSLKRSEFMAKVHKKGFVGKYNPFVYIVHPSKESIEESMIIEVEDDGTSNRISYEDFPIC